MDGQCTGDTDERSVYLLTCCVRPAKAGDILGMVHPEPYRGTSLIRNSAPEDPTVALRLGPYGGPSGGGRFLMSDVPL